MEPAFARLIQEHGDRIPLRRPRGIADQEVPSRPLRFSISAWAMNTSLASFPLPFRKSLASGSVVL